MNGGWQAFLQRWIITTLGVLFAAGVVDGVRADNMVALLAASLLLGVLNAFIRPLLMIVALPLLLLSLGLFTFVINALLLYFVANVVNGFYVADFWAAFKGALLISIVSVIAGMFFGKKDAPSEARVRVRRSTPSSRRPPRQGPPPDTGSGPVIDV